VPDLHVCLYFIDKDKLSSGYLSKIEAQKIL